MSYCCVQAKSAVFTKSSPQQNSSQRLAGGPKLQGASWTGVRNALLQSRAKMECQLEQRHGQWLLLLCLLYAATRHTRFVTPCRLRWEGLPPHVALPSPSSLPPLLPPRSLPLQVFLRPLSLGPSKLTIATCNCVGHSGVTQQAQDRASCVSTTTRWPAGPQSTPPPRTHTRRHGHRRPGEQGDRV